MAVLPGQKTFAEIVSEVGEYLFTNTSPSTTTFPTLSRLQTMVNDKQREICSKKPWWFLFKQDTFNTVGNTSDYALSDSAEKVLNMEIPAKFLKLQFMPRAQFTTAYPAESSTTTPALPLSYIPAAPASNNALQFTLFPTPDQVYTVKYWFKKRVAVLTGSDTPVIPPEWQDVLIHGVVAEAFAMMGPNDPRTAFHDTMFKQRYREMWKEDEDNLDWQDAFKDLYNQTQNQPYPGIYWPYLG